MPTVILGTKEIKAGIDETKTISFSLLSGSNDAVVAGAFISIFASVLFGIGLAVVRHVSRHNIWGWAMFGPALLNVLGQIGVLAYVQIVQGQHPAATNTNEIKLVNGQYDTDGKLYTREGWACSMDKLYHETEGEWAGKACSDLVSQDRCCKIKSVVLTRALQKTGRMMTFPLLACAAVILAIASWQIQRKGGFGWLFGRTKRIANMKHSKSEYIDLQ